MTDRLIIHCAPWLLPISHPPLRDGGLAVRAGKIIGVGRFQEIVRRYPGAERVDHTESVLMPGLVNAHTHLELSHLAHLSQEPVPASFTQWISHMLAERAKADADKKTILAAARAVLAQQQEQGVVALADIANTGFIQELAPEFPGHLLCCKEYLGLRSDEVEASLQNLETAGEAQCCTGHAPYSTHLQLLQTLKDRAKRLGHVFPVHVAESPAENDLIRFGTGEIRDFLEQRGFWDNSFQPTGTDKKGSVSYLHQHGLLDSRTLCVHAIHVTDQEMDLLAETRAKVCLCPGSNRYLGVDTAPVEHYLRKGILPALGTDSLTSNPELSIWREMRLLAEEHPTVDPGDILRMATLGGAEALGMEKTLGSLEAGKEARVLAIRVPASIQNTAQIQSCLVHNNAETIADYTTDQEHKST
ncbi:amidohydrolase family protein [Candidatus Electrothrix sp.]|uniref:amidohydrolase family protein n=1 Tax=Candidatus Electrothrix sp. TaxID=2170559 RepID=UPI004057AC16